MLVMGLTVTSDELINVLKNGGLITRSLLMNYACVPAITIVLLRVFDAAPEVAVGFLIIAVCPGAPYAPPLTAIAKGNVPVAVGLMLVLASSSALLAPLLLSRSCPFQRSGAVRGLVRLRQRGEREFRAGICRADRDRFRGAAGERGSRRFATNSGFPTAHSPA